MAPIKPPGVFDSSTARIEAKAGYDLELRDGYIRASKGGFVECYPLSNVKQWSLGVSGD